MIEWTQRPGTKGETWNPIAGCSVVSPGCTNCYAMRRVAPRLAGNPATPHYAGTVTGSKAGPVWTGKIGIASDAVLTKPLRWSAPRTVFVNSTSDLFHEDVPDEVIDRDFAIMALTPQHTYQVLTKRAKRMQEYVANPERLRFIWDAVRQTEASGRAILMQLGMRDRWPLWPLPNVWLGVSVEDQTRANERIPELLATPAAKRFVSAEPLLGQLNFVPWIGAHPIMPGASTYVDEAGLERQDIGGGLVDGLDWIIVGGESGNGARPMHPGWARSIRDQCQAAGVPFFFKQWGEWIDADHWLDHMMGSIHVDGKAWEPTRPLNFSDASILANVSGRKEPQQHSDGTSFICVGKHAAGSSLDGIQHKEFPA